MRDIEFSKEEIEYISETLGIILKDIREIYNTSDQKNLFLEVSLPEKKKYVLWIKENDISLVEKTNKSKEDVIDECKYNGEYVRICSSLETIKSNFTSLYSKQPTTFSRNTYFEQVYGFLLSYEKIRKDLIDHIKSIHNKKEDFINRLNQLRSRYGGEIFVHLGTNNSLNMQALEVTEENGKKVGTIDFGSRIVKIVSEGDIVLTKVEKVKELKKNKDK